jgi:DNA-binding response OmpR family regulator
LELPDLSGVTSLTELFSKRRSEPMTEAQPRILLVEDDDNVRVMLGHALKHSGYKVTECADGAEAETKLETQGYDLAILDLVLPGFNGIELSQLAKRFSRNKTKVMVVSAISHDTSVPETEMREKLEVDAYLSKPVDPSTILHAVARLLSPGKAVVGAPA